MDITNPKSNQNNKKKSTIKAIKNGKKVNDKIKHIRQIQNLINRIK